VLRVAAPGPCPPHGWGIPTRCASATGCSPWARPTGSRPV
jgi:hypothetical protein